MFPRHKTTLCSVEGYWTHASLYNFALRYPKHLFVTENGRDLSRHLSHVDLLSVAEVSLFEVTMHPRYSKSKVFFRSDCRFC